MGSEKAAFLQLVISCCWDRARDNHNCTHDRSCPFGAGFSWGCRPSGSFSPHTWRAQLRVLRAAIGFLPNPKRLKLEITQPPEIGGSGAAPDALAAFKQLASFFSNWGDVADLGDLHGFDEFDSPTIPSYTS